MEPILARMTFVFRGDKIVHLHSSALPERPDELQRFDMENWTNRL